MQTEAEDSRYVVAPFHLGVLLCWCGSQPQEWFLIEVCSSMKLHCRAIYGEALQLIAEQMALP